MVGHTVGLVGAMVLFPFTIKAKEGHGPECHSWIALRIPFSRQNTGVVIACVVEYGRMPLCAPTLLIGPCNWPWTSELLLPLGFCNWCVCDISVQILFNPLPLSHTAVLCIFISRGIFLLLFISVSLQPCQLCTRVQSLRTLSALLLSRTTVPVG